MIRDLFKRFLEWWEHVELYIAALAIGSAVGMVLLALLKKKRD